MPLVRSVSVSASTGCCSRGRSIVVSVQAQKAFFSPLRKSGVTQFNKYEIKRLAPTSTTVPTRAEASPSVLQRPEQATGNLSFQGVHHVALLCSNLEQSLQFYQGILGLEINPDRPHSKLPYRGAWLWIGPEMIHLMELPNPDPLAGRAEHGGRDRHFCVGVDSVDTLTAKLDAAGVVYTKSMSGRPAVFFRDPDMNCLECVELEPWR